MERGPMSESIFCVLMADVLNGMLTASSAQLDVFLNAVFESGYSVLVADSRFL